MEIRKVLLRTDGIKYLIIPKKSNIKAGDFVAIKTIDEKEVMKNDRRKNKRN